MLCGTSGEGSLTKNGCRKGLQLRGLQESFLPSGDPLPTPSPLFACCLPIVLHRVSLLFVACADCPVCS